MTSHDHKERFDSQRENSAPIPPVLGQPGELSGGKTPRGQKSAILRNVRELLWLLIMTFLAWVRPRQDLVLENLLLRHQLAVLTRPTRTRPRARLRI